MGGRAEKSKPRFTARTRGQRMTLAWLVLVGVVAADGTNEGGARSRATRSRLN